MAGGADRVEEVVAVVLGQVPNEGGLEPLQRDALKKKFCS